MSIAAIAKNKNEFSWKWKDSNRRWWSMLSHPTGDLRNQNAHNPEGDWVWCYHLFNELGEMVWEGEFVGQLDCVPKLRWLLEEWQKDVASAVIDGVAFEASGRK